MSFHLTFSFIFLLWKCSTAQDIFSVSNPVVEGNNFVFNCTNPSGSATITYTVDGLSTGPNYDRINPTTALTYTLYTFPNVTRNDTGIIFSCRRTMSGVTTDLGNITLLVYYEPMYITANTTNYEVYKGASFFLPNLTLDSSPDVGNNFSWTRNDMEFSSNDRITLTATTLNIKPAECSDNGVYRVTAGTFLGSTTSSFNLTVICPPVLRNGSNTTIAQNVIPGSSVYIDCTVSESYPDPTTITLKIGMGSPEDITDTPIYSVNNVTQSETYVCSATNARGITTTLTYQIQVMQSSTDPTTTTTTTTPTPTVLVIGFPIGAIVGIVVGVVVLACVVSILLPVLICCCLGVGVCAALGCAAKKEKDETELKGVTEKVDL